jgi:hypothetical protein
MTIPEPYVCAFCLDEFDAAGQALRGWSLLWWCASDLVIEVRCGDLRLRVRADRVQAWQAGLRKRREGT